MNFRYFWILLDTFGYYLRFWILMILGYFYFWILLDTFGYYLFLDTMHFWILLDTIGYACAKWKRRLLPGDAFSKMKL